MSEIKKELGPGMRLLLDVGPLILFFAANFKFGVFTATAVFIVAILIAMAISLALTRRVTALGIATVSRRCTSLDRCAATSPLPSSRPSMAIL